jgi:hypothetical protein
MNTHNAADKRGDAEVTDDDEAVSSDSDGATGDDAAATMQAGRLWDDFGDKGDGSGGGEAEAAQPQAGEQSVDPEQPAPESAFNETLETLASFGQSTSPTQVLVLSPTSHGVTNDIFSQITTRETSQNVVFVSSVQSTNNRLPMVRGYPEWIDGKAALIQVGNPSSEASTRGTNTLDRIVDSHKEIANPQNLAKLGVVISHELNQTGTEYPTVLCFHTLSSIEGYIGTESIVPFRYTRCSKCNDAGVMGYCHLDPNRHSADDVSTIKSAFDVAVRVQPDGSVEIE